MKFKIIEGDDELPTTVVDEEGVVAAVFMPHITRESRFLHANELRIALESPEGKSGFEQLFDNLGNTTAELFDALQEIHRLLCCMEVPPENIDQAHDLAKQAISDAIRSAIIASILGLGK